MPKIDNDETKHAAKPFLLIAQKRAGGTYLAHCLSTHKDVFCDRGESLHRHAIWRRAASQMSSQALVYALFHQEGYLASGFRAVAPQVLPAPVWEEVLRHTPRIIHLTRENKLRQGASLAVHQMIRMGTLEYYPAHTFEPAAKRPVPRYTMTPATILACCTQIVQEDMAMGKWIAATGLACLDLTYAEITGGEGGTQKRVPRSATRKLCRFLEVPHGALTTRLTRVHAHPLRAMFANWGEIEAAVQASPFAEWLEDEALWVEGDGEWTHQAEVKSQKSKV